MQEAKDWQKFQLVPVNSTSLYRTPKRMKTTTEVTLTTERGNLITSKQRSSEYTFMNLLEDFKREKFPLLKEMTRRFYLKQESFFEFFYPYAVETITPKIIDEWLQYLKSPLFLQKYKSSRTSFNMELNTLRTIFNWHIQSGDSVTWANPIRKRHRERCWIKPKVTKETEFMTAEQKVTWYKKIKEINPDFFPPAFVQTEQAMRVSETYAMVWDNLDFKNGIYKVTHHVIYPRTRDENPYLDKGTKTLKNGGFFILPLRQEVLNLLLELKKKATCKYLFHTNGNLFTFRQIQYAYNKAFKKAALPFSGTHICRHTGATLFLEETGDPLALQEMGN